MIDTTTTWIGGAVLYVSPLAMVGGWRHCNLVAYPKEVIFDETPGRILYEIEGRGLEGRVEIATGAWAVAQLHVRKRE